MPTWPMRPCSYPGCPNRCHGRFCDEHKKQENKRYELFDRDPDTKKKYKGQWSKLSRDYRKRFPLCENCMEKGIAKEADLVHHIVPVREGGALLDEQNLMSLCNECHSRIHAHRGDRWH